MSEMKIRHAEEDGVIVHFDKRGITVLCPLGHLIDSFTFDRYGSFAGSAFEAELSDRSRWNRLAARCQGAGH